MTHAESFRVKVVQNLKPVSESTRVNALEKAAYNVHRLPRTDVYLDFLTCKGLSSMSDRQWSGLMIGDEAYAGSQNFYNIQDSVNEIFNKKYVVPTHMGRGGENIIIRHLMTPRKNIFLTNKTDTFHHIVRDLKGQTIDCGIADIYNPASPQQFKGNVNIDLLEQNIKKHKDAIAGIFLTCSAQSFGGQVMDIDNLAQAAKLARAAGIPVILDVSQAGSASFFIKESKKLDTPITDLIRQYASHADILTMSAREDTFCHVGGLIATDDAECYRVFTSLIVVFEGLHTYGGQAGRDMESFARGLIEMCDEGYHFFRRRQFNYIEKRLNADGLTTYKPSGTNGILIDPAPFVKDDKIGYKAETVAAYIYLFSGIRLAPLGKLVHSGDTAFEMLGMLVPRRAYTERQIDYTIEAFHHIKDLTLTPLHRHPDCASSQPALAAFTDTRNELSKLPYRKCFTTQPEPYIIKVVEPMAVQDRASRQKAMEEAGYNTFLLKSKDVYIDLLTDSGTSAMSSQQFAAFMSTMESETGTEGYASFVESVRDVLGFRYILPTHQGRAAEHILSQTCIQKGQFVINNMYFTTTREHQEIAGGEFVDLIVDSANDTTSEYPFKGDIDSDKLQTFIKKNGPEKIAYICLETNVNMAGGQPVSMANSRKISAIAKYYKIPLFFDATRCAENAYFIKWKEPGFANESVKNILRQLMSLGDGCTISAKKDLLVNIGGVLAVNDPVLYQKMSAMSCVYEGLPTQGGLASRDLMCMAIGAREMVDEEYIRNRVEQTQYLGKKLIEFGVPIVMPPGGHAIFLDAKRFLDHIPQEQFPAQKLAAEIYIDSGVRAMERGIVSSGRDKKTGQNKGSELELVRLTIPRRVYTYTHMDIVAESIFHVYKRRKSITGLNMVYEPPTLRFFTARFEPIKT